MKHSPYTPPSIKAFENEPSVVANALLHVDTTERLEQLESELDVTKKALRAAEAELKVIELTKALEKETRRSIAISVIYQNMSSDPERCALHLEDLRIALFGS
jgi:membrane-bound lytic murein transglycosylase MltF